MMRWSSFKHWVAQRVALNRQNPVVRVAGRALAAVGGKQHVLRLLTNDPEEHAAMKRARAQEAERALVRQRERARERAEQRAWARQREKTRAAAVTRSGPTLAWDMPSIRVGRWRPETLASRAERQFEQIARSKAEIIVGPWVSEVGFEILYWIPFLSWAVKTFRIAPSRVTALSRGGVASWYAGVADHYADIFDWMSPDQFRMFNEKRWEANRGLQKHTEVSEFDRELLMRLGRPADTPIVHPELMYELFGQYWSGAAGADFLLEHTRYREFTPPTHAITDALPAEFVAAKFYSRPSLPMSNENQKAVERVLLDLAERHHVVCLNTSLNADDHGEFAIPASPNISDILDWLLPSDNLAVQSAVIARASRVYCTYGGFSYLPLLYGVPTAGFYSLDKHFMKVHGCAAYHLAHRMKSSLSVVEIGAWK